MRFMGPAAAYAYVAAEEAIKMSGLSEAELKSTRTAVVAGSGGGSFELQVGINDIVREKGPKRVGPLAVPKPMGSTVRQLGNPDWLARPQLFYLECLFDWRPLHWTRRTVDYVGQGRSRHRGWW